MIELDYTEKWEIVERETFNMINMNDLLIDSLKYHECEYNNNKYLYIAESIDKALCNIKELF